MWFPVRRLTLLSDVRFLSTSDRYGNKQSVTLRQDDRGGLAKVNDDGTQTELMEFKGVKTSEAPMPCENYINLKPLGMGSATLGWNTLFHESFDVMKAYYSGNTTVDDVSDYIRSLCSFGSADKSQISNSEIVNNGWHIFLKQSGTYAAS